MRKNLLSFLFILTLLPALKAQDPDMLEPNDRAEQAVSIDLLTPYLISIFPEGDYDYFSFTLSKPMLVQPQWKDATGNVYCELLDGQERTVSYRFPCLAGPGKYFLKIRGGSAPDPFLFSVTCQPATAVQSVPKTIEINKSYLVRLSSREATDSFSLRVGGKGYVTLQALQVASNALYFSVTRDGKEYQGNPLVIPVPKNGIINAVLRAGYDYTEIPFTLYASRQDLLDAHEPNDSIPLAVDINKSKRVFYSIYPYGDEDWFSVTTTKPGKIFADLTYAFTGGSAGGSFPYKLELYDRQRNKIGDLENRVANNGIIYGSGFLKTPGTYYLRASSDFHFTEEALLSMQLYGNVTGTTGEKDFTDIYFVGFELDSSATATLQALSESQGANYITVDSTSIEKTLSDIFEEARKKERSSPLLWWVLAGAAILVATFWIYRKRSSR